MLLWPDQDDEGSNINETMRDEGGSLDKFSLCFTNDAKKADIDENDLRRCETNDKGQRWLHLRMILSSSSHNRDIMANAI